MPAKVVYRVEISADIEADCELHGRRNHSFRDNPVRDLLSYLCETLRRVSKVVAIAHNARAFDSQFVSNRAILMKL